jgi:transposase-like protein
MARTMLAGDGTRPVRRTYPPALREQAVRAVFEAVEAAGGERWGVIPRVARSLDVGEAALRSWVRQAEAHRSTAVRSRHRRYPPRAPVVAVRHPVPPPPPAASPTRRQRARAAAATLRLPLLLYGLSRIVVLAAVLVAVAQPHGGLVVARRHHIPWPRVPSSGRLLDGFGAWDAGWYVHIATHGYVPPPLPPRPPLSRDIAFFPLFPLLVRWSSALLRMSPLAAGVAVALVLGAAATVAVHLVTRRVAGERVASAATALWCFFPGAFVLSFVYSEGLTVLCAAGCLLALLRRRWVLAGVAAAAAGATQPTALVLVACCAWAAAGALWSRREWRALAAPLIAPAGAAAWFGWLWARSGDPLVWFHSERVLWAHRRLGPYWTVVLPVRHLIHLPGTGWIDNDIRIAGLVVLVAGLALLAWWRPPAVLTIWVVGTVGLALMSAPVGPRPRFLLVAFPLVVAIARKLPRAAVYGMAVVEAGLLGGLTFITITTLRVVP